MQTVKFTRWRGARNPENGTQSEMGWLSFCEQLEKLGRSREHPFDKTRDEHSRDFPCFVMATFRENYRAQKNVELIYAIGLDFDKGSPTFEQLVFKLLERGDFFFAYTTKSHTPEHHRTRAILPFAEPVDVETFRLVRQELAQLFPGQADENAKDAVRLWYEPTKPAGAPFQWKAGGFRGLDGRRLAEVAAARQPPPTPAQSGAPAPKPAEVGSQRDPSVGSQRDPSVGSQRDPSAPLSAKETQRANKLLASRCAKVALAQPGERDKELRSAAAILGGKATVIAAFGRERVLASLVQAAEHAGLPHDEAVTKATKALEWGIENPLANLANENEEAAGLKLPDRGEDGKPKATLRNILEVLSKAEELRSVFYYDAFTHAVRVSKPVPGSHSKAATPRELYDTDAIDLRAHIAATYGFEPGKDLAFDAIARHAHANEVHPVRDYLAALKWDGQARLATMMQTYFGCPVTHTGANTQERLELAARIMMLSAVARVRRPGCKADVAVVLHGSQGLGKSTAIGALCSKPWFLDETLDVRSKDAPMQMHGRWFAELAELSALKQREHEAVKAFLSRGTDVFRAPYERTVRVWPRESVFVGTSNDEHPFTDRTGNRRFFSLLVVDRPDVQGIERERDQLWAEAVHWHDAGVPWWLTADEEKAAAEVQEAFMAPSGDEAWTEILSGYLAHPTRQWVTTRELATVALLIETARVSRNDEMRIGRIMADMPGWKAARHLAKGERQRGYERQP